MYNFTMPLLTMLLANRMGDSSSDAGRVALLSMMIRPPLGLFIALMMARQNANTAQAAIGNASGKGSTIVNSVIPIPKADHSFFPTFIGLTRKEAARDAKKQGLTAIFFDTHETTGREVVVAQKPEEGASWPRSVTEVTLYLG